MIKNFILSAIVLILSIITNSVYAIAPTLVSYNCSTLTTQGSIFSGCNILFDQSISNVNFVRFIDSNGVFLNNLQSNIVGNTVSISGTTPIVGIGNSMPDNTVYIEIEVKNSLNEVLTLDQNTIPIGPFSLSAYVQSQISTNMVTVNSGTLSIENNGITNVDTSVNNLLKTVFEVLKLLPFLALIIGGFYLLDRLLGILPRPGSGK